MSRSGLFAFVVTLTSLAAFPALGKALKIRLSDGTYLATYIYMPKGKGPHPGVIVLPVRRGMNTYSQTWSARLASKGYVTLAVNYRTGGGWPDKKVGEAYDYLQKLPHVDPKRIGMVGFSFGGQRELEIVSDWAYAYPPRPLRAMIAYYLGNNLPFPNEDVPPILFLHGDLDRTTQSKEIVDFCVATVKAGRICDYKIYKKTGHSFTHRSKKYGRPNPSAERDAFSRSVKFLNKHLRDASLE